MECLGGFQEKVLSASPIVTNRVCTTAVPKATRLGRAAGNQEGNSKVIHW